MPEDIKLNVEVKASPELQELFAATATQLTALQDQVRVLSVRVKDMEIAYAQFTGVSR